MRMSQPILSVGWKGTRNFIWAVWWIQKNASDSDGKYREHWNELLPIFEAEALRFLCLCNNPDGRNTLMDEYRETLRKAEAKIG